MKPESLFTLHDFSHNNKCGNEVFRTFAGECRYQFDFDEEMISDGWKQYDTDQDAWYYGIWVNPLKLTTLTYAEGDLTLVVCKSKEQYNEEIKRMNEFYGEGFIAKAFDENGTTIYRQDRNEFMVA